MSQKRKPRRTLENFLSNFKVGDGCWNWAGKTSPQGYGRFRFQGSRQHLAHRFSFETFKGRIPKGKHVCHTCDDPSCINPNHLFLGDHSDNMRDAWIKRRISTQGKRWEGPKTYWSKKINSGKNCGEMNGSNCKSNSELVHRIRAEYAKGKDSYTDLAKKFGIPRTRIFSALNKWKHLETVCKI